MLLGAHRIGSGIIYYILKSRCFSIDCFLDNRIEARKTIIDGIAVITKDNEKYFVFIYASKRFQDAKKKEVIGYGVDNYCSIDEEYLDCFCSE